ncbi:NAD(P)/FAD-dependent oxidoreductase [Caulobacter sp.]|jgi:thioredoxin reductase (NADPH)|uniref:NAD(P)/FAD-dependent oxidoreductase n=1 Tax=Caulobacter sp. TaxID=78 RepID=UPI0031DD341C
MDRYEVVIIGAGPAGLTAATYLGRYRRRVLILDSGRSRAAWIPQSHNTPGFPRGVGGPALLENLSQQASLYGAQRRQARARRLTRMADGFEILIDTAQGEVTIQAQFVLLATGVVDRLPDLAEIEAAIGAARVRMCPICDAYEAIDQRIAVLGEGDLGAREAAFLTTYSSDVTLLHLGATETLSDLASLSAHKVRVEPIALADLSVGSERVRLSSPGAPVQDFDCLYLALGCEMQSRLAVQWGAAHDDQANLIVNSHQETSIEGLYAAGDVVRGLNQIAVAAAEAAIAATDIHKRLRARDAQAQARL